MVDQIQALISLWKRAQVLNFPSPTSTGAKVNLAGLLKSFIFGPISHVAGYV